jgi:hypothetical protein
MPAIASLEDLRASHKELLETRDINELKKVFKKYRGIGWKNICKLWLEGRTPEELKGEGANEECRLDTCNLRSNEEGPKKKRDERGTEILIPEE